jgi:hypothetical protein
MHLIAHFFTFQYAAGRQLAQLFMQSPCAGIRQSGKLPHMVSGFWVKQK